MQALVYTREGCHLCDEAIALLESRGLQVETRDIDQDQVLHEQFNTCIPVVEIDGKIRFRGRVDPVLLARIVDSAELRGD